MRQLRHLQLFEAFESIKLSKILSYISSDSKTIFIERLKKISQKYDFQMSQFSDDMFQYLPFKKGLQLKSEDIKPICQATSKNIFGTSGIEGETCKTGKIKREWGSGIREVTCPNCSGTGFEPEKSKLRFIKFWFTSDGKFLTNTGVDGLIRKNTISDSLLKNFYVIKTLNSDEYDERKEVEKLAHLTKVFFVVKKNDRDRGCFATIWQSQGDTFVIQDSHNGGTPNDRMINGVDWRKIAKNSWNISGGDFYQIMLLEPKESDDVDVEDPYEWNVSLDNSMNIKENTDVRTGIRDAHFSLVLNLTKLENRDFVNRAKVRSERQELKSGSRLVLTDEEIKSENIKRYLNTILKNTDIVADISNIKKLVSRGVGGRFALFTLLSNSNYKLRFKKITDIYYTLLSSNEDHTNYYINEISNQQEALYNKSSEIVIRVAKNLDLIKKNLIKDNKSEKYLPIINALERISQKFYNKLMTGQFDSIEDLEISRQKILSLINIFDNTTYGVDNLSHFIEYFSNYTGIDRSYPYLVGWRVDDYYDKILRGLEIVEKLVERL